MAGNILDIFRSYLDFMPVKILTRTDTVEMHVKLYGLGQVKCKPLVVIFL
jgi:hypothetical protein